MDFVGELARLQHAVEALAQKRGVAAVKILNEYRDGNGRGVVHIAGTPFTCFITTKVLALLVQKYKYLRTASPRSVYWPDRRALVGACLRR